MINFVFARGLLGWTQASPWSRGGSPSLTSCPGSSLVNWVRLAMSLICALLLPVIMQTCIFFHSKGRFPVGVKGRSQNVVPWDDWLILVDAECRVEKLTSSQLFNNRIVTFATFYTHWKSASKHWYRQTCGNCPSIILIRRKEQKQTIK